MPYVVHHISRSLAFDPELLSAMGQAYDLSLQSFAYRPSAAIRESVASQIIALAERGMADPLTLSRRALVAFHQMETRYGPGVSVFEMRA